MMIGPEIETERLILRPPRAEDFPFFCQLMQEEGARFIGGPLTPPEVWRGVCTLTGAWVISGFSMFSVIEKDTGQWIGRLGPWYPEGWPGTEVGWGILENAQGRGLACEGASATMDYAVETLGWTEIIHNIEAENAPSIALAKRLGSRWLREATAPKPYEHITWQVYGQSADEWRARQD